MVVVWVFFGYRPYILIQHYFFIYRRKYLILICHGVLMYHTLNFVVHEISLFLMPMVIFAFIIVFYLPHFKHDYQ